jgi:signal transduction histidine kinase
MDFHGQAKEAALVRCASNLQRAGQARPFPVPIAAVPIAAVPTAAVPIAAVPTVLPSRPPESVDTVRALCHDLRQPLAAILLLAQARGGDVEHRFDGIIREARWLSEMTECVIGGAVGDVPERVDVGDLVERCVHRVQSTATCHFGFVAIDQAMAVTLPVALRRAVGCVLDNAVRAAGSRGQVTVSVTDIGSEVAIKVIDDGPGLGLVPTNNSLGLTITRALVASCGGRFELRPGAGRGVVAEIMLPGLGHRE